VLGTSTSIKGGWFKLDIPVEHFDECSFFNFYFYVDFSLILFL
jgi:hypothetical protein